MARGEPSATTLDRVRRVLDEVLDPCSVGRSVPAGLLDMGMVTHLELVATDDGRTRLDLTLRMTSPACTFQMYFDEQVRARLAGIAEVDLVRLSWGEEFDWSDDDMSEDLKRRLLDKRLRLLVRAAGTGPA